MAVVVVVVPPVEVVLVPDVVVIPDVVVEAPEPPVSVEELELVPEPTVGDEVLPPSELVPSLLDAATACGVPSPRVREPPSLV